MQPSRWLLLTGQIIVFCIAVELLCCGFAFLSIKTGNGFLFYYPNIYDGLTPGILKAENNAPAIGWTKPVMPRPHPALSGKTCGAVIGDSFSYAEDIDDTEAWPYLTSLALGCNIDNLGVGGFGLDQAYLYYKEQKRRDHVVILGLFHAMLRRDGAASYTFYASGSDHLPKIDITKPFFILDGSDLKLVPRPSRPVTRQSYVDHHEHDFYKDFWTELKFPYAFSVGTAIYKKLFFARFKADIYAEKQGFKPVMAASYKILSALNDDVHKKSGRLVIVMIPKPDDMKEETSHYEKVLPKIKAAANGACVIDLLPALHNLAQQTGFKNVRTEKGHYNPAANKVIAATVAQGIKDCEITP